ncbi:MAG: hypothetical protein FJW23_08100 [Acidimicrobiia bacterium]|nr:hypothetical protein [Acidimicrobiia bacterium]
MPLNRSDPRAPLRDNVRVLGEWLGATLREQVSEGVLDAFGLRLLPLDLRRNAAPAGLVLGVRSTG